MTVLCLGNRWAADRSCGSSLSSPPLVVCWLLLLLFIVKLETDKRVERRAELGWLEEEKKC